MWAFSGPWDCPGWTKNPQPDGLILGRYGGLFGLLSTAVHGLDPEDQKNGRFDQKRHVLGQKLENLSFFIVFA
jgi:hypothetical protein